MAQDIWGYLGGAAPGLFDIGAGLYGMSAGSKESAERLKKAQGPLYGQATAGAQTALNAAASMDPRAIGQERLNTQLGMLSGVDEKETADMMRTLFAKGQLGTATYNPGVEGIAPGTLMNPQMAAMFAGRGARNARMAADAHKEGEAQLDRQITRANTLAGTANQVQSTGLAAQANQPSRSNQMTQLLRGIGSLGASTGLFGDAANWLRNSFSSPSTYYSSTPWAGDAGWGIV